MTSSSRPSRSPSRAPRAPESILPDGEVGEGAAELLHEFVHPHGHPAHPLEETLVDDGVQAFGDDDEANEIALGFEQAECASRPWWRRPSAWWFLGSVPFSMTAFAATIAPRFEVLTVIVCYASDMRNQPEGAPAVTDRPIPCAKDPHIEAQVTAVITSMALITGILSCFMTGFWGSLSDRRGRVFILRLNVISLVVADTFFILVYWFPKAILGGYWALLIPSIIDGFLGGRMAASAAMHAYMTDCSAPATRSRIFSQFLGFMFIGLAVGPTMGSLITRYSHQAISAFYFAGAVHLGYAILVWFIIPESLMPTQMRSFRHRHAASMDEMRTNGGRLLPLKRLFSFLSPLAILMPSRIEGGGGGSPQKWKTRRDWSLTLLALAYFPDTMILGAYGVTFQFAAATYDWSSEMLGYWLSIVGASRALFLAVILPAILHFFRPKSSRIELPPSPSESHSTDAATASRTHSPTQSPGSGVKSKHVPKLDLTVSRLSLIALICSYIIMASSPPGWGFISASVLGSLSAGFVPTVQSLAIEIYRHQGGHETGKLFGALSTLSSLGSSIIGPFLYGIIYIRTVATVPTAIFFVSAGALLVSFFFLLFVRLPAGLGDDVRAHDREETLVGGEGPGETRREEEVPLTRDMDG